MELIQNCWWMLLILIAAITVAIVTVIRFVKLPTSDQLVKVKAWLLQAVTEAEREFGGKTGKIKLSYCYSLFLSAFPKVAKIITYDMFSSIVDEVLDQFKTMLQSNENLQDYVGYKEVP